MNSSLSISTMTLLTPAQVKRLQLHRYKCSGTSLLEPFLQVLWDKLVDVCPLWIAATVLSTVGFVINLATFLMLFWYCPTATESAPDVVYFVNAIGLFLYHVLDALDGRQAQRIHTETQLEELFDHGLDSISTVLVVLAVCMSLQLGNQPWTMMIVCISVSTLFYCGHWCSYVTGIFYKGKLDVAEVHLLTMLLFGVTGYYGPEFWSQEAPIIGCSVRNAAVTIWLMSILAAMIHFGYKITLVGCVQNGKTVADTNILSPGFSTVIIVTFAFIIANQFNEFMLNNYLVLYLLTVGIIFAKVTNRLIVAHISLSKTHLWDTSFVGFLLLFANQSFGVFFNEQFLLWICVILSILDLLKYLIEVYFEIAEHLRIDIFSAGSRIVKNKEK